MAHPWLALVLTEDDPLCQYPSKKCTNKRTTKRGGGLHRLCEMHRRRANRNQRRVDDKRRTLRAERLQYPTPPLDLPDPTGPFEDCATPTSEDIELLEALLLGADRMRGHARQECRESDGQQLQGTATMSTKATA